MKKTKTNGFAQLMGLIKPYLKGFMNIKNGSMLALLVFLLWQIEYDVCLKPNLDKLGSISTLLNKAAKTKAAEATKATLFKELDEELKTVPVAITTLTGTQSKTLVSLSQGEFLVRLAKGLERLPALPTAMPGDPLKVIKFSQNGPAKETTIAAFLAQLPDGATTAATPAVTPTAPPPTPAVPTPPTSAGGAPATAQEPPLVTAASMRKLDDKTDPLTQFDYTLVVQGPYVTLADLVNQLVLSPSAVSLRQINLRPAPNNGTGLEMTLQLSMLMAVAPS
jgi:hypothetical protein